jgi:hypothetical protein
MVNSSLTDASRNSFGDEYITILTGALVVNKTIKILTVNGNNVTANGWSIFSCVLRSPICSLTQLSLCGGCLDDEGITFIGYSLVKNKVLTHLDLSGNCQITSAGWQGFSICLMSPTCALQELDLSFLMRGNINDDTVISFATALATNKRLCSLKLNGGEITDRIWLAFTNFLCDNSSPLSTYYCNHTLQTIRMVNNRNLQVPKKIARVLKMNAKHDDKKALARQKIIANHFSASKIDTCAFSVMPVPLLPHAIDWIGRDLLGFSLMYQVSRAVLVPKLFE